MSNQKVKFIHNDGHKTVAFEIESADINQVKRTIEEKIVSMNGIDSFGSVLEHFESPERLAELLKEDEKISSSFLNINYGEVYSMSDNGYDEGEYTIHSPDLRLPKNCIFIEYNPYSDEIERVRTFSELDDAYLIGNELKFDFETTKQERIECEINTLIHSLQKDYDSPLEENLIVMEGKELFETIKSDYQEFADREKETLEEYFANINISSIEDDKIYTFDFGFRSLNEVSSEELITKSQQLGLEELLRKENLQKWNNEHEVFLDGKNQGFER